MKVTPRYEFEEGKRHGQQNKTKQTKQTKQTQQRAWSTPGDGASDDSRTEMTPQG